MAMNKNTLISVLILVAVLVGAIIFINKPQENSLSNDGNSQEVKTPQGEEPAFNLVYKEITKEEYMKYGEEEVSQCHSMEYLEYRDCIEKPLLQKHPNVKRTSDCVVVVALPGGEKKICDIKNENDPVKNALYVFSDYVPDLGYFFDISFWEGSAGLVIDEKNGSQYKTWSRPVLSPKHDKFIAATSDIEAGYIPNGFQLWEKNSQFFSLKLQYFPDDKSPGGFFGISSPVWVDNNTFYFVRNYWHNNEYTQAYASYALTE